MKCQVCDKEELLPFQCSYCQGYFCVEHRLPEKHECPNFPKEPLYWYLKKKQLADSTERGRKRGLCPKCRQGSSKMVSFDAKTMTFKCKNCGHKFTQAKKYPHDILTVKDHKQTEEKPKKSDSKKPKKRASIMETRRVTKPKHKMRLPLGKIGFVGVMVVVSFAYVYGLEWAFNHNFGEGIISLLPLFFVLSMCHEMLHALAWWSFGYSAIPIPILIPPILGITIGEKPRRFLENFIISLAPLLLTATSLLVYNVTGNEQYLTFGIINLAGMIYDIPSAFIR